jgi:hypothetical protein
MSGATGCGTRWKVKIRKAVGELAATNVNKDWPVQTLVLLGKLAEKSPSLERVGVLLERAQQRRPGDLWVNQALAEFFHASHPQRLEEESR